MERLTKAEKSRYYPNFIESRRGNTVNMLTEVVGGGIHRRSVKLGDGYINLQRERDLLIFDAERSVRQILAENMRNCYIEEDTERYTLDNLPDGVTILDVMNEARREGVISLSGNDLDTTEEDVEVWIYQALERKRNN